jgi:hypothetical protein
VSEEGYNISPLVVASFWLRNGLLYTETQDEEVEVEDLTPGRVIPWIYEPPKTIDDLPEYDFGPYAALFNIGRALFNIILGPTIGVARSVFQRV